MYQTVKLCYNWRQCHPQQNKNAYCAIVFYFILQSSKSHLYHIQQSTEHISGVCAVGRFSNVRPYPDTLFPPIPLITLDNRPGRYFSQNAFCFLLISVFLNTSNHLRLISCYKWMKKNNIIGHHYLIYEQHTLSILIISNALWFPEIRMLNKCLILDRVGGVSFFYYSTGVIGGRRGSPTVPFSYIWER